LQGVGELYKLKKWSSLATLFGLQTHLAVSCRSACLSWPRVAGGICPITRPPGAQWNTIPWDQMIRHDGDAQLTLTSLIPLRAMGRVLVMGPSTKTSGASGADRSARRAFGRRCNGVELSMTPALDAAYSRPSSSSSCRRA
jgi:hypothetical protein